MSAFEINGEQLKTWKLVINKFLKQDDLNSLDISSTGLNPYKVRVILQSMEYDEVSIYNTSAIYSHSLYFKHEDLTDLRISFNSITFKLDLIKVKKEEV